MWSEEVEWNYGISEKPFYVRVNNYYYNYSNKIWSEEMELN